MPEGILVVGFGNPAREDDGLGPAVAALVEEAAIDGVSVDIDYQLSVEHAADVAKHEIVVFIDASVDAIEPFVFETVTGIVSESFSSHSVSPEQVIGLAESLFNEKPKGFILGIRGYSFEMFTEELTQGAADNMRAATTELLSALRNGNIEALAGDKT